MNKLFIAIMLLGTVVFFGCTGDKPANAAGGNSGQTNVGNNSTEGYVGKPQAVEDSRYASLLVLNYWVFEKYYHPEKAKKDLGKGRWFKFEKDGTFVSGRWQDQTANGTWRLYTREGKQYILLDSSIDYEDAEFEIQAINGEADTMAWVGTPAYPTYDPVSLIVTNLLSVPTKAQFGVQ